MPCTAVCSSDNVDGRYDSGCFFAIDRTRVKPRLRLLLVPVVLGVAALVLWNAIEYDGTRWRCRWDMAEGMVAFIGSKAGWSMLVRNPLGVDVIFGYCRLIWVGLMLLVLGAFLFSKPDSKRRRLRILGALCLLHVSAVAILMASVVEGVFCHTVSDTPAAMIISTECKVIHWCCEMLGIWMLSLFVTTIVYIGVQVSSNRKKGHDCQARGEITAP